MPLLKGNAIVGQAGGPTAVINQSLLGVIDECLKLRHIDRLLGARDGLAGIVKENFVNLKRQPDALLRLIAATPGAALGSTRDKLNKAYAERMLDTFRRQDIRYFFYIGGNDSAATVRAVQQVAADVHYDLRAIHIPKTIDNDLLVNDHCPGFGSAARFVAMAFIGDNLDNRALSGIKINVLMGRDAGFITAASVLARRHEDDGPHLIYLPERTFDLQRFIRDVAEVVDQYDRAVIAVSEGIRDDKGEYWTSRISKDIEQDSFGHVQLSGSGSLADFLAGMLRSNLPHGPWRIRADTFGYLQRSFPATISKSDAWEARMAGQMAVIYSLEDIDAGSVVMTRMPGVSYACGTRLVPLIEVAPDRPPRTTCLPDMYITAAGNDIDESYLPYVGPLVGELPQVGWFKQITAGK